MTSAWWRFVATILILFLINDALAIQNPYEVLEISRSATAAEIRKAFRARSVKWFVKKGKKKKKKILSFFF
jgi:DnaJ-class molecular chaperone